MRLRVLAMLFALCGTFLLASSPAQATRSYSGVGDDVVRIPVTSAPTIVKLTHQGESNFIVWALTSTSKKVDLLANEVGDYKGTTVFNVNASHPVRALSVQADGAWTIKISPLSSARYWAINAKGTGSDVLKLTKPSTGLHRLTIRHSGDGNIIVWALNNRGKPIDLLVNDIGSYRGRVSLPAGTRYATVTADGPWSIVRR